MPYNLYAVEPDVDVLDEDFYFGLDRSDEQRARAATHAEMVAATIPDGPRASLPPAERATVWRTADEAWPGFAIDSDQYGVVLTLGFGYRGSEARDNFGQAFRLLRALRDEHGLRPFDDQLGRIIDLDHDFDAVLSAYQQGASMVGGVVAGLGGLRRPWWKRLLGRS